eukprot:COSAG01_NODE_3720_length_5764_cov_13.900618_6_plen_315_part_00
MPAPKRKDKRPKDEVGRVAVYGGALVGKGDLVRWRKENNGTLQVPAGTIGKIAIAASNEKGTLLSDKGNLWVSWPTLNDGKLRSHQPEDLMKAVSEADADSLLRVDNPLPVGTPICVAGRGRGVYIRAETHWISANEHVIDFASGGIMTLVLKDQQWTVRGGEMRLMARLTDRWKQSRARPCWVPDGDAVACMLCGEGFTTNVMFASLFSDRHHCRSCGWVICSRCSMGRVALYRWLDPEKPHGLKHSSNSPSEPQRVCDVCRAIPSKVPPLAKALEQFQQVRPRCARRARWLSLTTESLMNTDTFEHLLHDLF